MKPVREVAPDYWVRPVAQQPPRGGNHRVVGRRAPEDASHHSLARRPPPHGVERAQVHDRERDENDRNGEERRNAPGERHAPEPTRVDVGPVAHQPRRGQQEQRGDGRFDRVLTDKDRVVRKELNERGDRSSQLA